MQMLALILMEMGDAAECADGNNSIILYHTDNISSMIWPVGRFDLPPIYVWGGGEVQVTSSSWVVNSAQGLIPGRYTMLFNAVFAS